VRFSDRQMNFELKINRIKPDKQDFQTGEDSKGSVNE